MAKTKQKPFKEKFKLWLPPVLLFVILFAWMGVSYWLDHRSAKDTAVSAETTVTVDSTFKVTLPCIPPSPAQVAEQDGMKTTTITCTLMNDDGSVGNTYYTSNKTYREAATLTPEIDFAFCGTYTDGATGEIMTGVKNYQEDISRRVYQFCEYTGDKGTNLVTAKTTSAGLQTYAALGKQSETTSLAQEVRTRLKSLSYVN